MSYYVSVHTDYTNPRCPEDIDNPAMPYFLLASNARVALELTAILDSEGASRQYIPTQLSVDDIEDETTIVLLDPIFELMRKSGWTVTPPGHKTEENPTLAVSAS